MSNRTLLIIIAIVLVSAVGGAFFLRQRALKSEREFIAMNQNSASPNSASPAVETPGLPRAETQNTGSCERRFDQNKLQTDKVSIANRQAEISVKDFGKIRLEFFDKDAPKAVENFLRLANAGYFDCISFHRVAKGFVIQGGDPTGTGSGGDSAFGGKFADELNPETESYKAGYKKGVLAMANAGSNTNTSQFFIMLADVALQNSYTIFGRVIAGQDVVDKIGQVEIVPQLGPTDGKPQEPVVMESVQIIK